MKNTLAIAKRELNSYFYSPIAYVVTFFFMLFAGIVFVASTFQQNQPAEMRTWFGWFVWVVLTTITPAISMRLISEELHSGTIEPLMTSPVSDLQVILGKWLGALGFFAAMLILTLAFVIIIEIWADPDYGPIISGYTGLLLVGGLYLAIGTFISTLTRNQIVAFISTLFSILLLTIGSWLAPQLLSNDFLAWLHVPSYAIILTSAVVILSLIAGSLAWLLAKDFYAGLLYFLIFCVPLLAVLLSFVFLSKTQLISVFMFINVNRQFNDFAKGLIDISNIVFFLSAIALFLTLAVKALESRKWR